MEPIPFSRVESGLEGKDLTGFKSSEHLVHVLKDSGRPAFLFGSTPPREGTTEVRPRMHVHSTRMLLNLYIHLPSSFAHSLMDSHAAFDFIPNYLHSKFIKLRSDIRVFRKKPKFLV